jgi:hypothetical protein
MMLPKRTALLWAPVVLIVAAAVLAALTYGYQRQSKERASEAESEKAVMAESKLEPRTNGEPVVHLNLSTQRLIGLQTAPLAAATNARVVKGYGRVLEPAPLIALGSETASARAALVASSKEYQRLKTLFDEGQNASARALESAKATMQHDQIALQAAEAQFVAAWGEAVAQKPDLTGFMASLAKLECVVVRLDLPAAGSLPEAPMGAGLAVPGTSEELPARYLGRATTTDPQVQGEGFLFAATNAAGRLAPGLALTGFLLLPGAPLHGVVVPDAAIVRAADRAWVYVQTDDTTFQRRALELERPVAGGGWFVTKGLGPGERVVVTGAQALLSEERKTQIKVGD